MLQPVSQRSDAKANRVRLMDAARTALAADPEASLNSIAKQAGVGAGTLYRHFPSREELVVAINRRDVEGLERLAHELLAAHDPVSALQLWCDRLLAHVVRQRGFRETLRATLSLPADKEVAYRPVRDAIALLLRAGADAGVLRDDVDPTDVQLLLAFIWQIQTEEGERRARRAVGLIISGLRP